MGGEKRHCRKELVKGGKSSSDWEKIKPGQRRRVVSTCFRPEENIESQERVGPYRNGRPTKEREVFSPSPSRKRSEDGGQT